MDGVATLQCCNSAPFATLHGCAVCNGASLHTYVAGTGDGPCHQRRAARQNLGAHRRCAHTAAAAARPACRLAFVAARHRRAFTAGTWLSGIGLSGTWLSGTGLSGTGLALTGFHGGAADDVVAHGAAALVCTESSGVSVGCGWVPDPSGSGFE
jgi:hypothetical protein